MSGKWKGKPQSEEYIHVTCIWQKKWIWNKELPQFINNNMNSSPINMGEYFIKENIQITIEHMKRHLSANETAIKYHHNAQ